MVPLNHEQYKTEVMPKLEDLLTELTRKVLVEQPSSQDLATFMQLQLQAMKPVEKPLSARPAPPPQGGKAPDTTKKPVKAFAALNAGFTSPQLVTCIVWMHAHIGQ